MKRSDSFMQEQVGLQAFDAIQLHHFTRIRLFLKNGLNANMRDSKKRTLLMCSCSLANQQTALKFVNLLLTYKARIELSDTNGLNALHYAVVCGHERIVSRFLEFAGNFDINSQDNEGNTALMLAVLTGSLAILQQIVKTLRKYDLSADISNNEGITPLIQATILGENEMAKCLVTVGRASPQIRDKHFGKSASEWGRTNVKKRTRLRDCCPARNRAIHSSPPQILCLGNNQPRNVKGESRGSQNSISKWHSPKQITREDDSKMKSCNWSDLKLVYGLYQQQLSNSYRRSAPPGRKTPPSSSNLSGGETSFWRTAALSMRLKQRRHTVALSRSLPSNLSTKSFFSRRSFQNGPSVGRSLSIGTTDQVGINGSKWSSLCQNFAERNTIRRLSDTHAQPPSTAPGGLDSTLCRKSNEVIRRSSLSIESTPRVRRKSSVTFQSVELENHVGKSTVLQSSRTGQSSVKYNESGFRKAGETSLPIFEYEEDAVGNDHERT